MKLVKITSIVAVTVMMITVIWAKDSYWTDYISKLRYNFKYNYMVHRNDVRWKDKVIKIGYGKRARFKRYPTTHYTLGWNKLPSDKEVERRVNYFRSIPMYFRKAPFKFGEDLELSKEWTIVKLYAGYRGSETSWRYPKIAWFDNLPAGAANRGVFTRYISQNGKYKWMAHPDWSIAHPEKYPEKYRIWAAKKKPTKIGFLGMIDDDLMYDWRNENVQTGKGSITIQGSNDNSHGRERISSRNNLISTNKSGVFIYVYDQDTFRDRSIDWKLHDRLAYGYKDSFIEDNDSPSERYYLGRKGPNRARLEYGPIEADVNSKVLRALRVRIFTRTYLAKLRLARLCVAAPKWTSDYSDSRGNYTGEKGVVFQRVNVFRIIKKYCDLKKYPSYMEARKLMYRDIYNNVPVHDYWYWVQNKIYPPDEVYKEYELWLKGKGDLQELKMKNRVYNLTEDARSMYWMFALKNPGEETRRRYHRIYYSPSYLSIAVWSGSTGYGPQRHYSSVALKTIFPYFEGRTMPGRMGIIRNGRAESMNTGGLLQAGFITRQDPGMRRLLKYYGSMNNIWKEGEKGPFMIVSDRTYKRYGHGYFEKLAKHPLVKADVTGAMIDSSARVMLDQDPDYVKQLMDMDYFYIKEKDPCIRKGNSLNCTGNSERSTISHSISGSQSMLPLRDISISTSQISKAKSLLRKSEARGKIRNPLEIFDDKPITSLLFKLDRAYDGYVSGIQHTEGKIISVDDLKEMSKRVQAAYIRDQRQYPGMSILRAHYLPYKGKKLRGYAFIKKMNTMRSLINRYKNNKKELMKHVLIKHFPFFVGNPNMFLAYYSDLRRFLIMYRVFTINGLYNQDEDGTVMYGGNHGGFQAPAFTTRRCIDITDKRGDNWLDSYLYAVEHDTGGASDLVFVANRGRLRKRIAKSHGIIFPRMDTLLHFYQNQNNYTVSPDDDVYIEMTNPRGRRTLMRDLGMLTNDNGVTNQGHASIIYNMFPGFHRYIPAHLAMVYQLFYQEYYHNQRRNELTYQNDILTPIYPAQYEPSIMTTMRMTKESKELRGSRGMKGIVAGSISSTIRARSAFLHENLEFVVANGLPTTVIKKKDRSIDIWNKSNEKLYEGIEVIE